MHTSKNWSFNDQTEETRRKSQLFSSSEESRPLFTWDDTAQNPVGSVHKLSTLTFSCPYFGGSTQENFDNLTSFSPQSQLDRALAPEILNINIEEALNTIQSWQWSLSEHAEFPFSQLESLKAEKQIPTNRKRSVDLLISLRKTYDEAINCFNNPQKEQIEHFYLYYVGLRQKKWDPSSALNYTTQVLKMGPNFYTDIFLSAILSGKIRRPESIDFNSWNTMQNDLGLYRQDKLHRNIPSNWYVDFIHQYNQEKGLDEVDSWFE